MNAYFKGLTAFLCAVLMSSAAPAAANDANTAPANTASTGVSAAKADQAAKTEAAANAKLEDEIQAKALGQNMLECRPLVEWPVTEKTMPEIFKITILGKPVIPEARMVEFVENRCKNAKLNCSLKELVGYYYIEGFIEGIRPDVAICQALKETGNFGYGGDVLPKQNNYCGLGAVGGGAHGYAFLTPQRGVRAHIQHLSAYANTGALVLPQVDPRYDVLVTKYPHYHGASKYWSDLNGKWAVPGTTYGQEILMIWYQAQGINIDKRGNTIDPNAQEKLPAGTAGKVKALVNRGDYLRTRYSDMRSVKAYDEALALDPNNEDALLGKGQQLYLLKDFNGALQCFDRIIEKNPKNALALYDRGGIYKYLGNEAAAKKDLKAAKRLDPTNPFIEERLR